MVYPPAGPLPLPGNSTGADRGCDIWERVFDDAEIAVAVWLGDTRGTLRGQIPGFQYIMALVENELMPLTRIRVLEIEGRSKLTLLREVRWHNREPYVRHELRIKLH